jgi:hypothetical protein
MLNTYRALLRGHILEWLYDEPKVLPADQPVSVYVTILDETSKLSKRQQGKRMALALQKLAQLSNASLNTLDALSWERDVRQERTLPDRNHDVS